MILIKPLKRYMKPLFLFLSLLFVLPALSRGQDRMPMTINSVNDDEYEIDNSGIWLVNSEIIVTLPIHPDTLLFIETYYEGDIYPDITQFHESNIVEMFQDSVSIRLPGHEFGFNECLHVMFVCGNAHDGFIHRFDTRPFCIKDYLHNEALLKDIEQWTAPVAAPQATPPNRPLHLFDLSGCQILQSSSLNHQLKRGIYIRDGKKVVVR